MYSSIITTINISVEVHTFIGILVFNLLVSCVTLHWGTPGYRLPENPLLTPITFFIGIHGYRIFIIGLFHNQSARNLLTAKTIHDDLE